MGLILHGFCFTAVLKNLYFTIDAAARLLIQVCSPFVCQTSVGGSVSRADGSRHPGQVPPGPRG